MNNNNLISGNEYIITIKNIRPSKQYIKTYVETIQNLNGITNYKFRDNNNNITTFRVDSVTIKPYTSNSNNSILGKRQTTTINDNELDAKKSKTDMTFTEEDILKDREYWESVDGGGKRTRRVKRKSKKAKKRKSRKSRKYNK